MIYLIQKAWSDPLENRDSWGYSTIGAVSDRETAERLVAESPLLPDGFCWGSDWKGHRELRFEEIPELTDAQVEAVANGECQWECRRIEPGHWGTFAVVDGDALARCVK